MPISTPAPKAAIYGNDKDHFIHVLDHLFRPAIEKMGYTPIPPSATGSDLIHAEIIKRLELDDLVLCDMSTLNPNVFFELGIRTALDKPTCLIRDETTTDVPFDTGVINHHVYDSTLAPWKLHNQIELLATHLTESVNRSEGRNTLWRYFGLSKRAELTESGTPMEAKIDLILRRLEMIEAQENESFNNFTSKPAPQGEGLVQWITEEASRIMKSVGARIERSQIEGSTISFDIGDYIIGSNHVREIKKIGADHGYAIVISQNGKQFPGV